MDRICTLTLTDAESMLKLLRQHEAILVAVDARDADGAQEALEDHMSEILRASEHCRRSPELFDRPACANAG